jgi:thiol-disulfide isomerase/thioredoxin
MSTSRLFTAITAIAILVLSGCLKDMGEGAVVDLVGKAAPDISLTTVDNKPVVLADQKGKVVVVDFWATWCGPCRMSLPHVQKLSADADRAAKGLVVWAVNDREDAPTAAKFLADSKYNFTVPMDAKGTAMDAYGVHGIPTTVIIGRDGIVKNVFVGYSEEVGPQIDAAVDAALSDAATKPG